VPAALRIPVAVKLAFGTAGGRRAAGRSLLAAEEALQPAEESARLGRLGGNRVRTRQLAGPLRLWTEDRPFVASVLAAFAPFLAYLIQQKAYEPAAATVISFALTWACMGIINLFGRGQEGQIAGGH